MSSEIIHPDHLKRQFNFERGQPFLYRPLSEAEIMLYEEWVAFYSNWYVNPQGKDKNSLNEAFRIYLSKEHYKAELLRPINGRSGQAFQNLLIAKSNMDIYSAVRRFSRFPIQLTPVEKRLAFREVVEIYRKQNKDKSKPLPSFEVFDNYHQQGLFLPNTGVTCPSRFSYRNTKNHFNSHHIFILYAQYFSIPSEISIEELSTLQPPKLDSVRAVLRALNVYRTNAEKQRNIILPDLDISKPDSKYEFMQIVVKASLMFRSLDNQDTDLMKMLLEFQKRYGQIDAIMADAQEQALPVINKRINKRGSLPASSETLKKYIETWKILNPDGINLDSAILVDPPSAKRMKDIRSIQFNLVKEHGELPPDICAQLGIPSFPVPTPLEIDRYVAECGGSGFSGLLRDIENLVSPNKETSLKEILENTNGIIFNSHEQLKMLGFNCLKSGEINFQHFPRNVLRFISTQLDELEQDESLHDIESIEEAQEPEVVILDDVVKTRIDLPVELDPEAAQRIVNLENMMIREWHRYVEKTSRRSGVFLSESEMETKFLAHLQKTRFDERLFNDGLTKDMRLFKGFDEDGEPLSFIDGLLARIDEIGTPVITRSSNIGIEGA